MFRGMVVALFLTAFLRLGIAQDNSSEVDPTLPYRAAAQEKWEAEVVKLETLDKQTPDPEGAILFIGSSSIRRWSDLATDMSPRKTINRAYGGAKFSDLAVYAERIIKPHNFKAMVIFVGNDIVGKEDDKSPAEIVRLFKHVVQQARKTRPTQPILLIAITPTPSRFKVWPQIRAANAALQKACEEDPTLHFIETEKHYLTDDGKPIEGFFVEDKLHQNRDGYLVWGKIIKDHLDIVLGPAVPAK